jgi:hypothetical protein
MHGRRNKQRRTDTDNSYQQNTGDASCWWIGVPQTID